MLLERFPPPVARASSRRPQRRSGHLSGLVLPLAAAVLATGCREGEDAPAFSSFIPIPPSTAGSQGCNGASPSFQAPVSVYTDAMVIGPKSQLAAAWDAELIYVTGADGTIRELDVSGAMAVEPMTPLVGPGVIQTLIDDAGVPGAPELSGIAIADENHLIVAENTSNTLLWVRRDAFDDVSFLVGKPDESPGFSPGLGSPAAFGSDVRFHFLDRPAVVTDALGNVYVADDGNHAIRRVRIGAVPEVVTLSGFGAPGHRDGDLSSARFDTPTGITISCTGELLICELEGHRLRAIGVGTESFFGGFQGAVRTLAGDGMELSTEGVDTMAQLAGPVSPVTDGSGLVYWADSTSGVLRRYDFATGESDCPGFADCTTATMTPPFSPMGNQSLALTQSGQLYVLDEPTTSIYRVL